MSKNKLPEDTPTAAFLNGTIYSASKDELLFYLRKLIHDYQSDASGLMAQTIIALLHRKESEEQQKTATRLSKVAIAVAIVGVLIASAPIFEKLMPAHRGQVQDRTSSQSIASPSRKDESTLRKTQPAPTQLPKDTAEPPKKDHTAAPRPTPLPPKQQSQTPLPPPSPPSKNQ